MRSEILFVSGHHTSAMHGSMVPYIGHAAMRPEQNAQTWSILLPTRQ